MIQRGSSRILVALNAIWRSCRVTDWNWSALLLHEFCLLIAATSSSKSIGRRPARHVHNSRWRAAPTKHTSIANCRSTSGQPCPSGRRKDPGRQTYRRSRLDASLSGVPFTRATSFQNHSKILQVAPTNRGAHRYLNVLLGPQIELAGLDGGVSMQKLSARDRHHSSDRVWRRYGGGRVAPKRSRPICFDDCSTSDQTAQSLRLSRLGFPLFETERCNRPSSIPGCDDLKVGQHQARPGVLDPNREHLKKGKFMPAKDSLVRLFQ
jgi:hypothetical protein